MTECVKRWERAISWPGVKHLPGAGWSEALPQDKVGRGVWLGNGVNRLVRKSDIKHHQTDDTTLKGHMSKTDVIRISIELIFHFAT